MIKFLTWIQEQFIEMKELVLTGEEPILLEDTTWDDKAYALLGRRLTSNQGKVDYDYNELAVKFQADGDIANNNDLIIVNGEYPHSADENGFIYPHLHFWQTSNDVLEWTLEYRIQDNGVDKTTAWNTMTATVSGAAGDNIAFNYASGTLNQLVWFKENGVKGIDMTGHSLSATIQFKFTRTDSNSSDVLGFFFDYHWPRKRLGSKHEIVR